MIEQSTLRHAVRVGDSTITIDHGELVLGMEVILDDEHCTVTAVLTPTQAQVKRGVDGSLAAEHPVGTTVWCEVPRLRVSRPSAPDMANTLKQGACPLCGCTGIHTP